MRPSRSIWRVGVAVFAAWAVASAASAAQDQAKGPAVVADLSTRFRFLERYTAEGVKPRPEVIGQYRVAIRETNKLVAERPQAAPLTTENTFQTIYTERPAVVIGGREVTDALRHYEAFRLFPDRAKPGDPRPLEGMTLWYHPRALDDPLILNLTENHPFREIEYAVASRQMFLPDLRGVLPALPSRVGDAWRVSRSAMQVLLADRSARGEGLTGKLLEVRRSDQGSQWVAIISVTGRAGMTMTGETAVNARLVFTFAPLDPAQQAKSADGVVEAWGGITELRMALTSTAALSPRPDERLRKVVTRETVLERQWADPGAALLPIPNPPPKPTEANSWLTFDDPVGRFHFRFPQDLQQPPPGQRPPDGSVDLLDHFPEPRDTVEVLLQTRTGKPEVDRQLRDPDYHLALMEQQWKESRTDVVRGPAGWLPEADWAPLKMKVYKMEVVLKATARDPRRPPREHLDFYLVLFARDECLVFMAETAQDPPTAFSKQALDILRSFQLGPAKP